MCVNILFRMCSIIVCKNEFRPRGKGKLHDSLHNTEGVKLKCYVSLHRVKGSRMTKIGYVTFGRPRKKTNENLQYFLKNM